VLRVGIGYDAHKLVEGRKLVLGGVELEFPRGLQGHSDGDVLSHAIADALLGAARLGDLGNHFPDTDPDLEGVSSMVILERVRGLLAAGGFTILNIDATVVAQEPRISPHTEAMAERIAAALAISVEEVSVKASTTERMGFEGRGEGMSSVAVALVEELPPGGGVD